MSQEDPLVAELRGEKPIPGVSGIPGVTTLYAPEQTFNEDPLETNPAKAAPSHVQKSDAKHATRNGGRGYAVTVAGQYYAPAETSMGRKVTKPYEITVNVPKLEGALSVIKNELLAPAIKRKHPDYLGYRTYNVIGARPLNAETPESSNLAFMTRAQLEAYASSNRVPVVPAHYPKIEDLRAAVVDYTLNPEGFAKREGAKQAERAQRAELAELNPELNHADLGQGDAEVSL